MFASIINYCKGSFKELHEKVTWPTQKQLIHDAIVVLVASIVIALIVFCMDTVFEQLMKIVYRV